jgi:hypothetical protein
MLKVFVGIAAVFILMPYSEFVVLLVLLWVFWEDLGSLTLKVCDDYRRARFETAPKQPPSPIQCGAHELRSHADRYVQHRSPAAVQTDGLAKMRADSSS